MKPKAKRKSKLQPSRNNTKRPTSSRAIELRSLARTINDAHKRTLLSGQELLNAAVQCGEALTEAKEVAGHGNWLDWLAKNCPDISEDTAQHYMRVSRNGVKDARNLHQAYQQAGIILLPPIHRDVAPEPKEAAAPDRNGTEEPAPAKSAPMITGGKDPLAAYVSDPKPAKAAPATEPQAGLAPDSKWTSAVPKHEAPKPESPKAKQKTKGTEAQPVGGIPIEQWDKLGHSVGFVMDEVTELEKLGATVAQIALILQPVLQWANCRGLR
jgi:hypothetical protein